LTNKSAILHTLEQVLEPKWIRILMMVVLVTMLMVVMIDDVGDGVDRDDGG